MAPDKPAISSELSRELNLFHITMMGLGMMIGAGVFIGIGISVGRAGPGGTVMTFAFNGLIALCTAMSFAELSSAIPRAGGAYNFARIAFGRGPSFLAGWMEWFASSVAGSLYAVVFAAYTLRFFQELGLLDWLPVGIGTAERIVAMAVAGLFLYINYRGASEIGRIGALCTVGQMIFVCAIAVIGIGVAIYDPERLANFDPFVNPEGGWMNLLVTMGFIYVAFEGFEVIAQAGDEAIDPKKNIPKAMLYSVLIVTTVYVAVSFATIVAVKAGAEGVDGPVWKWIGAEGKHGFGNAVTHLLPGAVLGRMIVALAVIFSATSALNATIYSATRASYALGRDHMLPPSFAAVSKRHRTPYVALAGTGLIVLVVAGLLPTADVASCASMMFLFLFFLVNLCVIRIRWNMGDELSYGFLMPLFPLPPILAIVCQAVLAAFIVHMSQLAWIIGPLWVLAGLGVYFGYSKSRALATADEIRIFEGEKAEPGPGYKIMVAVANPDSALQLVQTTYKLCGAKQARVELLHMVPVPGHVPLDEASKYMLQGKEGILEAMLYLAPLFPITTTIRYCRNIARGIISAVREKRTDMLILGWHGGGGGGRTFKLGSTIDPIIERAPCNVVILKDCGGNRQFNRVLVPVAGGPNGKLAMEIANILADRDEGLITALTVETGPDGFDVQDYVRRQKQRLNIPEPRARIKVVQSRDIVQAILDESAEHDLVVLGATRQPILKQILHETIPDTVAKRVATPLVMVNAAGGISSWVRRWV